MIFYDAHCHKLLDQAGGFFIGLEGEPIFADVISNNEALRIEDPSKRRFAVEYITASKKKGARPLLKYHPRREKYSVEFVKKSINLSSPKLCIIDTLNQPFWTPKDYWEIAQEFPEIEFIFCHAGGYDILEFLKIAEFGKNISIDFSLTQEYFGWCGGRTKFPHVVGCIDFAIGNQRLKRKVLFGSDEPFFSQKKALEKYAKCPDSKLFLEENFLLLIQKIKLI